MFIPDVGGLGGGSIAYDTMPTVEKISLSINMNNVHTSRRYATGVNERNHIAASCDARAVPCATTSKYDIELFARASRHKRSRTSARSRCTTVTTVEQHSMGRNAGANLKRCMHAAFVGVSSYFSALLYRQRDHRHTRGTHGVQPRDVTVSPFQG